MSEFDRASKAALLVKKAKYDLSDTSFEGYREYDNLVNKKSVCSGYAQTYSSICYAVGLKSLPVLLKGQNHELDEVTIDGENYLFDATSIVFPDSPTMLAGLFVNDRTAKQSGMFGPDDGWYKSLMMY